jgi:hypothetical protein
MQKKQIKPVKKIHPVFKKFTEGVKPDIAGVFELMKKINKIIVKAKSSEEIRTAYNSPAHEFLKKNQIAVQFKNGVKLNGCYQQSQVLYFALKQLGMKPKLSRFIFKERPHTTVFFKYKGVLFEADTLLQQISPILEERISKIKKDSKEGKFRFIKPGELTYSDFERQKKEKKV